ncbi:MAG: type II toxin-antitoxin system YafQ family toxin [Muribaculaceae bacterium]|nr:type II toxin-antitoxin system YafQ family toxin [Muribaculaceae bacterium]
MKEAEESDDLETLDLLTKGIDIPDEFRPHLLHGNYKNHLECHVENDSLLIWFDRDIPVIKLVRYDFHSELF